MAFPTPVCCTGISSTTVSADLKVQPVLLRYSSLNEIRDWHSLHAGAKSLGRLFLLFPHVTAISMLPQVCLIDNAITSIYESPLPTR